MREIKSKVQFNNEVARDTYLMGLKVEDEEFLAEPGQFVMLRLSQATDPLLRRPFSICGTTRKNTILILYRVVGRGTFLMAAMLPGAELSILGPLGKGFRLPDPGQRTFLVAGGIGVAPLLFLASRITKHSPRLLIGYRSQNEIIDISGFDLGGVEIVLATEDGSTGYHGVVTDLLASELNRLGGAPSVVCTCGPPAMMQKVSEICLKEGIPCQVSLEAAMACGVGACLGCAVRNASATDGSYYHVCKDGPVFDAMMIEWESL